VIDQPLHRVHLFEPLNAEQLARVRDSTHEIRLQAGQPLFSQGDPARHFFMVLEGSLKLFLLSREGEEKVIELVSPDQFFAEAVMFMEHGRYPVNASALTESRLLAFDNHTFLELLQESRELTLRVLAAMSRRLHALVREIDELTLHNATYRFVTYLLQQERTAGTRVDLPLPKQIIASRLSIKPETLSRILARLREQGLVEVAGESITLIDEPALRTLLER
jgi:CRP/FNR family transcriptional regulator, dissimilatory nitrate respiration regulator